jgi:hypothetical protein
MYRKSLITGWACVAFIGLPTAAYADDAAPNSPKPQISEVKDAAPAEIALVSAGEPVAAPEAAPTGDSGTVGVSDDALGEMRGGQAIVIGNQTLSAVNSGSIINGNYTAGAVAITDNALSNFNGLGNVLINTGALNNLQSAMNVTINFGD